MQEATKLSLLLLKILDKYSEKTCMFKGQVLQINDYDKPALKGSFHKLTCLQGEYQGKVFYLLGEKITLGRSEEHDLSFSDDFLSKNHLEFVKQGKKIFVTDLKTTNGTYINNKKILQQELKTSDILSCGRVVFKYEYTDVQKTQGISRRFLYLCIIALLLLYMNPSGKKIQKKIYIQEDQIFLEEEVVKQENILSEEVKKYYQKGLRELSNKNYLRAQEEFSSALSLYPKDSYASFYLKKSNELYKKHINQMFAYAEREQSRHNYIAAKKYYCILSHTLEFSNNKDLLEQVKTSLKKIQEELKDFRENICL